MSDEQGSNEQPGDSAAGQTEPYSKGDGAGNDLPSDRPDPPFINEDGKSRVGVVATPAGGVVVRPGEWTVDLSIAGLSVNKALAQLGGKEVVTTTAADRRRARILEVLRVDVTNEKAFGQQLAGLDGDLGIALRSSVRHHTVFLSGALTAAPMHLSPMHLSPMHLSPMHLSPMHLSGGEAGGPERFWYTSTARPAQNPGLRKSRKSSSPKSKTAPCIAILDTGIPSEKAAEKPQDSDVEFTNPGGDRLIDRADFNGDKYLDIAGGHATFIRTIIQRANQSASVRCLGVMKNDGDGDEAHIADALLTVFDEHDDDERKRLIVNLSFGGYYEDDVEPPMVARAIRKLTSAGAVVVAAAGNDGDCRKKFPAAMSEVIGVSALGRCGPAPFSNHGHWVDVAAPGEDLVSQFFTNFTGPFEPVDESIADIDNFDGWAMWSGTSFATPAVVGALAQVMRSRSLNAVQAVDFLIRRPGLFRIPDYGVVVNRIF